MQARLIERFCDTILEENGIRYQTGQPCHDLNSLDTKYRNMIEDRNVRQIINIARAEEIEALKDKKNVEEQARQTFYNKNSNFNSPKSNGNNAQSSPRDCSNSRFAKSLCKAYNSGRCNRMATYDKESNQCELKTATGTVKTKHLCNMPKPDGYLCGQNHPAVNHHNTPTKTPVKNQK